MQEKEEKYNQLYKTQDKILDLVAKKFRFLPYKIFTKLLMKILGK